MSDGTPGNIWEQTLRFSQGPNREFESTNQNRVYSLEAISKMVSM